MGQKNTIIYIHGFNGDGVGRRVDSIRSAFPEFDLSVDDYPADPSLVIKKISETIESIEGNLFLAASSLGGFYAWYCAAVFDLPCFLFNPSLRPYITLDDRGIGTFQTWIKRREYIFKKEYLEKLRLLKKRGLELENSGNLHFFVARNDEMLDHNQLPELYPNAPIHWFEEGGHRLENMDEILPIMKQYIMKLINHKG